jgi:hypothetical protein
MTDDEMKSLKLSKLQDQGLLFLWVTSRAMDVGRECMIIWGYELIQELVWVKTNQLQRIIRTGRTGHWLNHSKEHCLIGRKGNIPSLNVGLDCDVLVSEVRETSRKPDELYSIINRLSPGTRKLGKCKQTCGGNYDVLVMLSSTQKYSVASTIYSQVGLLWAISLKAPESTNQTLCSGTTKSTAIDQFVCALYHKGTVVKMKLLASLLVTL